MKRFVCCLALTMAMVSGLFSGVSAQDAPAENTFIVTFGSGAAWHPYPKGNAEAAASFQEKVKSLAEDNPDALLIDLGNFTGPASLMESIYTAPSINFFHEADYDAVNMTAQDYFYFAATGEGVMKRPAKYGDLFLSGIEHPDSAGRLAPLPFSKVIETAAGKVELISIADVDKLVGLPMVHDRALTTPAGEIIAEALQEKEGPAVLLSDYAPAINDDLARSNPALDLILETAPGPMAPRQVGSTFIVGRGAENQIQVIETQRSDSTFSEVSSERVEWIDEEDYAALVSPPLPVLGMSIPGEGRVAERFDVTSDNVRLDVFRDSSYDRLTTRKNIYIYHILQGGQPYRVIRVHHPMEQGWIMLDAMLQLNSDHTIKRVEVNDQFYSISYFPTRMGDVIAGILNKPVEQWDISPEMIAGYELQAEEVLDAFRKAIELDKILYPGSDE